MALPEKHASARCNLVGRAAYAEIAAAPNNSQRAVLFALREGFMILQIVQKVDLTLLCPLSRASWRGLVS